MKKGKMMDKLETPHDVHHCNRPGIPHSILDNDIDPDRDYLPDVLTVSAIHQVLYALGELQRYLFKKACNIAEDRGSRSGL